MSDGIDCELVSDSAQPSDPYEGIKRTVRVDADGVIAKTERLQTVFIGRSRICCRTSTAGKPLASSFQGLFKHLINGHQGGLAWLFLC